MSLLYINLVPSSERSAFENKVASVASNLGINPNWLMQVMKAESGLRADIQNLAHPMQGGNATGLIQFSPDTAKNLGTTTDQLKRMSRVDQMDYVEQYFKPYASKIKSYFDLYLITFFPAAAGHSSDDEYVFETKNISRSSVAKGNPTIDINKDGKITMAEFKQYLKNTVQKQYWDAVFGSAEAMVEQTVKEVKKNALPIVLMLLGAAGIITSLVMKK